MFEPVNIKYKYIVFYIHQFHLYSVCTVKKMHLLGVICEAVYVITDYKDS